MVQLLHENLALAFAGALLGFLFSCIFLWLGKDWMLGDGAPGTNFDVKRLALPPSCGFRGCIGGVSVVQPAFCVYSCLACHPSPIAEVLGGE